MGSVIYPMFEDLLLDVDYITVDGKAHLRLFFRGRVLYDRSFQPYFYVAGDGEGLSEELSGLGRVEKVRRTFLGGEMEVYKLVLQHPSDVPKARSAVKGLKGVAEVYEHDILFARRYLIDRGLFPLDHAGAEVEDGGFVKAVRHVSRPVEELRVMAFDIETYNPKGAPRAKVDPVIMISLASNTGLKRLLTYKDGGLDEAEVLEDEKAVLARFAEIVDEEKIDLLVGYNSDQFDLPYLVERAGRLGVELRLGRDGSAPKIKKGRGLVEAVVAGRPHIDLYPVIRRSVRLSSYVLEDVVKEVLGREKEKVPTELMWRSWDAGGRELERFMRYSLEDAEVTLELAEKFLPLYVELSRIVGLTIHDVARMTAGQLVEWLLIRDAYRRGELVPNKGGGSEYLRRAEETYAGGYVMEPRKGIVENIVVFDFRSLYPSIIVTHNIDPMTIRRGRNENSPPDLNYHFVTDPRGFMPSVLMRILERRLEAKRKMKMAVDQVERRMLDVSQNALKIIANSFYGYLGYPRARWYNKECAESVTSFARMYTKKVMGIAEKEYGFEVVYGDTDSLFVVAPPERLGKAMEFMEDVNKRLPGTVELEYDGFYPRGIFITKKRYALIDEEGRITVKGLETVRRDWTKLSRETQEKVLSVLLREGDAKKAAEIVKETIARVKRREVSLEEITIYTQLTRDIKRYKNVGPHVKAAQKAVERGREVYPGMPIGYIIKKGKGMISDRAEPVEDVTVEDYDVSYYVENQILPPVARIMEALGYSQEHLKEELVQDSLRRWF